MGGLGLLGALSLSYVLLLLLLLRVGSLRTSENFWPILRTSLLLLLLLAPTNLHNPVKNPTCAQNLQNERTER